MKLIWLRLENFRQFKGRTPRIEFAQGPERNVTIIHGNNGAGKTTILNALTWAFYGKFTEALDQPDQLINRQVLASTPPGKEASASVEIQFEHNERKYHLMKKRIQYIPANKDEEASFYDEITMNSCGEDGCWKSIDQEDIPDTLGRILPEQLHSYFFFDGERIERLQRPDKQAEITSAISKLIGEEVIKRAIYHLEQAEQRLQKDFLDLVGDEEAEDLYNKKSTYEKKREELNKQLEQHSRNLDGYRKEQQAIQEQLRRIEHVKGLQEQRDDLNQKLESHKQALQMTRGRLGNIISDRGYLVFMKEPISVFQSMIAELRNTGELPSEIKTPFVKRLLDAQECICGRSLHPGDEAYKRVEEWMFRSRLSDVEAVALRMEGIVDRFDNDLANVLNEIMHEQEQESWVRTQISRLEDQLEKISEELKGSPEESVRELERRLSDVETSIQEIYIKENECNKELEQLKEAIIDIDSRIASKEAVTAQQQLAKRRLKACQEAREILQEVRSRQRTYFRTDLVERMNRIFSGISFKPYFVHLTDDYRLMLLDEPNGRPVGKSTGESQILSLSFIGAIIEQTRELTARKDRLPGPDSSTFPIVMDSPFGNLDPVYRKQVAASMPSLADQVICLVSRSQWQGGAEQVLESRIGREYVLSYSSPKPDAQEDTLERFGKRYDLVRRSDDGYEHTEIVEVIPHGR